MTPSDVTNRTGKPNVFLPTSTAKRRKTGENNYSAFNAQQQSTNSPPLLTADRVVKASDSTISSILIAEVLTVVSQFISVSDHATCTVLSKHFHKAWAPFLENLLFQKRSLKEFPDSCAIVKSEGYINWSNFYHEQVRIKNNFFQNHCDIITKTFHRSHICFMKKFGEFIASCDAEGLICLWNIHGFKESNPSKHVLQAPAPATHLVMHERLLFAGLNNGMICVWHLEKNDKVQERALPDHIATKHTKPITHFDIYRDVLYSAAEDGYLCPWTINANAQNPAELIHLSSAPRYRLENAFVTHLTIQDHCFFCVNTIAVISKIACDLLSSIKVLSRKHLEGGQFIPTHFVLCAGALFLRFSSQDEDRIAFWANCKDSKQEPEMLLRQEHHASRRRGLIAQGNRVIAYIADHKIAIYEVERPKKLSLSPSCHYQRVDFLEPPCSLEPKEDDFLGMINQMVVTENYVLDVLEKFRPQEINPNISSGSVERTGNKLQVLFPDKIVRAIGNTLQIQDFSKL